MRNMGYLFHGVVEWDTEGKNSDKADDNLPQSKKFIEGLCRMMQDLREEINWLREMLRWLSSDVKSLRKEV